MGLARDESIHLQGIAVTRVEAQHVRDRDTGQICLQRSWAINRWEPFDLLAEQPRMGRLRPEFGVGVRSFAVESYVIGTAVKARF
jgi:hypothetical protein